MGLIDFNTCKKPPPLDWKGYDFTIIGCGAIGIYLALQLARAKKRILVIESGQLGETQQRQELNASTLNRPDLDGSVHWGRKRALGGTTIRWGGQALPYREIDFQTRGWTTCPAWPISAKDLTNHYREAESYLGVQHTDYYDEGIASLGLARPFHSKALDYHLAKWARQPDMFKRHHKSLKSSVDVLFNTHCVDAIRHKHSVSEIEIRNYSGLSHRIPVKKLILANGGLESVRFLLAHQLSNASCLGHGFMEHPCMELGIAPASHSPRLQRYFSTRRIRGQKYSIRLSISEHAQRKHELLNASCGLMFVNPDDKPDLYNEIRNALSRRRISDLIKLGCSPRKVIEACREFVNHGIVYKPDAYCRLTIMGEQEPIKESHLGLDTHSRDAFGVPKLSVHWRISELTLKSFRFLTDRVKRHLEETFQLQIKLQPLLERANLKTTFDDFESAVTPVNHHMGGAKMGTDPAESVVNDQLQVHGLTNVYVCSSAVFPSSSHSNPTLTALALASRLTEHTLAQP